MVGRSMSTIICEEDIRKGHTICISSEGTVYSFGKHEEGAHGHAEEFISLPQRIGFLKDIVSVDGGVEHTLCLDSNGIVFSFGSNKFGQLGTTAQINKSTHIPQQIVLPKIKQISCGHFFSICASENGDLYSFGRGECGQLGHGEKIHGQTLPKKIDSLKNVDFVECGTSFVICKTLDGDIYCFGYNRYGQLGNGKRASTIIPLKCDNWPNDVVDIKCGQEHTLVLTSTLDIYTCGRNNYGQLGRETLESKFSLTLLKLNLPEIIRIECGIYHSLCIDINNDLFVFGYNGYGQLGLGDYDNRYTPVKHPSLSNIIDISSKGRHVFTKTSNNEIYAFGSNYCSQLGIETKTELQNIPIQVFQDNEDIWCSNLNNTSKFKSARK